jgi:predicted anti-sigma-YlaC factor YlaD
MKLRLNCQEVSRLISEGLDESLPAPDRARMRLHFVICENCRNVNEQLAFMRRAMRMLGQEASDAGTPPAPSGKLPPSSP